MAEGKDSESSEDEPPSKGWSYDNPGQGDVVNISHLTGNNSSFFIGADPGGKSRADLVFGPIGREEVRRLLRWYRIRPIDDKLKGVLEGSHCVVLRGLPGTGRRTGAVHALAGQVGDEQLVDLGIYDGSDLARFDFRKGCGYLLDATAMQQVGSKFTIPTLRQAQDRLRREDSYLVVLGLDDWKVDEPFVRDWEGPTLEDLVEARSFDPPLDIDDLGLEDILGEAPSVRRMVELLDRLEEGRASGRSDEQVLNDLPERERPRVREWYAAEQTFGSWLLMSTLVFFSGIPKREFDRLRLDLQEQIEQTLPQGEEDRETVLSEFITPDPAELAACMAEVRSQTSDLDGVAIGRQMVCFQQEAAAEIHFEEYWDSAPRRLRSEVQNWISGLAVSLSPVAMTRLAQAVAMLTHRDSDSGRSILDHWARTPEPAMTKLAALAVDALGAQAGTRPLAFALAREWSAATKVIPKQYTALYIYTGNVGVFQIRQAIRVYRFQYRWRPFWVRATFAGFTEACIASSAAALELARDMASLGVVRKGEIDDAAFGLVDRWFIDTLSEAPLAIQMVVADPHTSSPIASIIARTLQRSYNHEHWLEQIVPWADSDDVAISEATLRLLHDALTAIGTQHDVPLRPISELSGRARSVAENLVNFMDRARQRKSGPTSIAVDRCTAVIDDVLRKLDGRPELNE